MELFTTVSFSDQATPIDHSSKILALGSCFAEHIGGLLGKNYFDTVLNPFGISYHPLVIHKQLLRLINNESYELSDLENRNELWHSWDHHGRFSHLEQRMTLNKINAEFKAAQKHLEDLDYLILTFGTAYGLSLIHISEPTRPY